MNNQSQSLLSKISNHQLQQLRRAPTLEEKDQLITKFKQENAQAQEVQRQMMRCGRVWRGSGDLDLDSTRSTNTGTLPTAENN